MTGSCLCSRIFRFAAFVAMLILFSSCFRALAEEKASFQAALDQAIQMKGPFYTWTLSEKAAFYDSHVYHGVGTRRGVPDERHIAPTIIRQSAPGLLADVLSCSVLELSKYTIDLDFWIEAFMDNAEAEHEYYSVYFLLTDTPDGVPHNVYQLMMSAYSGELIEAMNVESGWVWRKTPYPAQTD